MSQIFLNLSGMTTLIADGDSFTRGITSQIIRGFGAEECVVVDSGANASQQFSRRSFDLCILEARLEDMSSADLVRWIRRLKDGQTRFMPIIVLTSYTQRHFVAAARDSGANLVVKKPVSPRVLFDRISWIARCERPFIETDLFFGPDRRFRNVDPADGIFKRETDRSIADYAADDQTVFLPPSKEAM